MDTNTTNDTRDTDTKTDTTDTTTETTDTCVCIDTTTETTDTRDTDTNATDTDATTDTDTTMDTDTNDTTDTCVCPTCDPGTDTATTDTDITTGTRDTDDTMDTNTSIITIPTFPDSGVEGEMYDDCFEAYSVMGERLVESELRNRQLEEDFDYQQKILLQCVSKSDVRTENDTCSDIDGWLDKDQEDCSWYEEKGMCRYNYLHIYANQDNVDAYQACCACGGGVWSSEQVRRRFL
eukprot:UN31336